MSTSWQWFPETKTAICCYCGFTTRFVGDDPGDTKHDCDPAKHEPIATRQGPLIGRCAKPEALSRPSLDQLLPCIHRGPALRQEQCATCEGNVGIKIFACAIHGECQFEEKIAGVKSCGQCSERAVLG